jgi:hypothetical protein
MNNEELTAEVGSIKKEAESLKKIVLELERISIKVQMDPTTILYLAGAVRTILASLPTQTYSVSSPTGTAPTGSLWMKDTGVLATNEIHVYSGSAWIRMK